MFLRSLQRVAECSPDSPLIRIGFAYAVVVCVGGRRDERGWQHWLIVRRVSFAGAFVLHFPMFL
eukprot:COSAG02_NODE_31645_length_529_cov_13.572093_1_plen_63_part_10